MTIVVVNHAYSTVCGIHDLGRRIYHRLAAVTHRARYVDARNAGDLPAADVTLFNYRADLMPWAVPVLPVLSGITAAILHNYDPDTLDVRAGELLAAGFDRVVVLDPAATPSDRRVVTTGRFLPDRVDDVELPADVFRVGSFGFAFPHKRFDLVAALAAEVGRNSPEPVVLRLHTPEAYFNGAGGRPLYADAIREACLAELGSSGVKLEHTTDHRSEEDVVAWLAGNHVNCLLYTAGQPDAGLSSALDYLLAARRPIIVSDAAMFRHGGAVTRTLDSATRYGIPDGQAERVIELANHYDATAATQLLEGLAA